MSHTYYIAITTIDEHTRQIDIECEPNDEAGQDKLIAGKLSSEVLDLPGDCLVVAEVA